MDESMFRGVMAVTRQSESIDPNLESSRTNTNNDTIRCDATDTNENALDGESFFTSSTCFKATEIEVFEITA
jgi:hypothetical protein